MEKLETTQTSVLMLELVELEREIDLKIQRYNLLANEICKRFSVLEEKEGFKPKILVKGKIKI